MSECRAEPSIWPDYNEGFPVERHISWVGCCQAVSEEVEVCVCDNEPHPFCSVTMDCDPLLRSSWHPASEDNFLTSLFKSSRQGSGHRILYHYSNFIFAVAKFANVANENKINMFWKQRRHKIKAKSTLNKIQPMWSADIPNTWYICLQYTPNKAHSLFLRPYVQSFSFPPKKKQQKNDRINASSL